MDEFVECLNGLVGDDSTVPRREASEELVSLLSRIETIDEATGLQLRDLVLRTFAGPKFDWRPVETAIGLTSPACEFRDEVTEAMVFCALRHLAMQPQRGPGREDWSEAAAYFERAVAELDKGRAALAHLLEDNEPDKWLQAEYKSLNRCAQLVRLHADLFPKRAAHSPPMSGFRSLVQHLAAAFQRATGARPSVSWNAVEDRYQGRFLALVDAVLPGLSHILGEFGLPPLTQPKSAWGRGRLIIRALHPKDKTSVPAH